MRARLRSAFEALPEGLRAVTREPPALRASRPSLPPEDLLRLATWRRGPEDPKRGHTEELRASWEGKGDAARVVFRTWTRGRGSRFWPSSSPPVVLALEELGELLGAVRQRERSSGRVEVVERLASSSR